MVQQIYKRKFIFLQYGYKNLFQNLTHVVKINVVKCITRLKGVKMVLVKKIWLI